MTYAMYTPEGNKAVDSVVSPLLGTDLIIPDDDRHKLVADIQAQVCAMGFPDAEDTAVKDAIWEALWPRPLPEA